VHQHGKHQVSDVVDTIAKRMQRSEDFIAGATRTATMSEAQSVAVNPSSINHARFAAMSARLAQVAARASADMIAEPALAYEPVEMDYLLRFLTDVRRITDAMAQFAMGDCLTSRNNG
jgi:hypothetical protein